MRCHTFMIGFGMIAVGVLVLPARAHDLMATHSFVVYRSDQQELPVSFEYPADWRVEYSKGTIEAYAQVQIYGPDSLDTRLRTYLVVRALPPKTKGGRYADVGEMIEAYRNTLPPSLRIDHEGETTVLGEPSPVIDISGTLPLPWNSQQAQQVPVKSQRVFFEHHGRLYELAWMATPEASSTVNAAFSRLLQTLALVE